REEEVVLDILGGRERGHLGRECRHLVEQGVLVESHSDRQVNHPRKGRQRLDRGIVGRLTTREDVGGDAPVAEGAADLAYVDIESAVGVLAQRCGGRGVHGYDRDPPLRTAVQGQLRLISHGMPISRQASASRRSRTPTARAANKSPCRLKRTTLLGIPAEGPPAAAG